MEVAMLTFAKQMPIAPSLRGPEHDTRVWRVIEHHVHTARATLDFSGVTKVGCDETSVAAVTTTCRSLWISKHAG